MLLNVAEFQEAFQLFDSRGDGKIHVAQIGDALRALGQNPTESDVKKCTLHLKPDERISFEVFLPIYQVRHVILSYLIYLFLLRVSLIKYTKSINSTISNILLVLTCQVVNC